MSSHKLLVYARTASGAEALSVFLSELNGPDADAVSLFKDASGGWTIEAYYSHVPDIDELSAAIVAFAEAGGIGGARFLEPPALTIEALPQENWVALSQAGLPPVVAGRFVVHGSHDHAKLSYRRNAIEIDAGEAFGTAHHETTLGCLLAIDELARLLRFRSVLDLGCGSAVLAIATAKTQPAAHIIASDIDAQATAVAHRNIGNNGQAQRIDVITATGFNHARLQRACEFDLVIANILAAPLIELAHDMAQAIKPRGIAILSGLLTDQAAEVIACYRAAGFFIADHKRLGDWSTLTLQRRALA